MAREPDRVCPGEDDRRFAEAAVEGGFLTREQLEECEDSLRRLLQAGEESSLARLAVERGFISQVQADELTKELLPTDVPRRVGNYEVIAQVGKGGMGAVYKAKHITLNSYAAVKFLPPELAGDSKYLERFEREAELAAQLTTPYTVRTFDVGEAQGVRFILMEYVAGENLANLLKRRGKLPVKEALSIIHDVGDALREAHEIGIVHRDIKPANILITRRGVPRLSDLGVAKNIASGDQGLTLTGFVLGTPSYMSPEQAQGLPDIDGRSDIYSLGATLYRMVVGNMPFKGETPVSVMHKIATKPVPDPLSRNPQLPREIGAVICKMMAKEREVRYQTVGELMRDIEAVRAGEHTGLLYEDTVGLLWWDKTTRPKPLESTRRRTGVLAVLVVLALVGGGYLAARAKGYDALRLVTRWREGIGGGVPGQVEGAATTVTTEESTAEVQEGAEEISEQPPGTLRPGPEVMAENVEEVAAVQPSAEAKETLPREAPGPTALAGTRPKRDGQRLAEAVAAVTEGDERALRLVRGALATTTDEETRILLAKLEQLVMARRETMAARKEAGRLLNNMGTTHRVDYTIAESKSEQLEKRLRELNAPMMTPEGLDEMTVEFNGIESAFKRVACETFDAMYPGIEQELAGQDFARGLVRLCRAREKLGSCRRIEELAARHDPDGTYQGIARLLSVAPPEGEDYSSSQDAAQACKAMDEAIRLLESVKGDAAAQGKVLSLKSLALRWRAAGRNAEGKPLQALADACLGLALGGTSRDLEKVMDEAVARSVEELGRALADGRENSLRFMERAGRVLGGEDFAVARERLSTAIARTEYARPFMADPSLTRAWFQNVGAFQPVGMVRIPQGEFPLGVNHAGLAALRPSNAPQHMVALSGCFIDMYEVTNQEFQKFVDAGGYHDPVWWEQVEGVDRDSFTDATGRPGPAFWGDGHFADGEEDLPVVGVSWYEAAAYARWIGKRLPTEAQWECAALGVAPARGQGTFGKQRFPWGESYATGVANLRDNGLRKRTPVGSRPGDRSPLGCLDMGGNVREWTCSAYERYPGSECEDNSFDSGMISVRGACWYDSFVWADVTLRRAVAKGTRDPRTGFRCAWSAPDSEWEEQGAGF